MNKAQPSSNLYYNKGHTHTIVLFQCGGYFWLEVA